MNREEAQKRVEALGGLMANSVTNDLTVLVATNNTSAKWKKAEELNQSGNAHIELWTEEKFLKQLQTNITALNNKLFEAIKNNDKDEVQRLINAGADVNAKNFAGKTPLHICSNIDVTKALIDAGADVNAKDNERKTPLHCCEDDDVKKLLIASGAKQ